MDRGWVIALCVTMVGCGGPAESRAPDAEAAMTAPVDAPFQLTDMQRQGRLIYETMCWTCHGTAGRGDGPAVQAGTMVAPPTFHTQDYANASTERLQRRFRVNLEGADPAHPHMQYVASLLQPERFSEALSFVPAIAYPAEIPGSALAGEAIYRLRCAACHGTQGHGDGPAARSLVLMKPVDFTTDTLLARRDWDAVFTRIREGGREVHGSSMPPWGVILTDAEMWDLVAYLATFQPGLLEPPPWHTP